MAREGMEMGEAAQGSDGVTLAVLKNQVDVI